MADDLRNKGPADRTRVNVDEPSELRWWCAEFGCTESELRLAVAEVGAMAEDVADELKG